MVQFLAVDVHRASMDVIRALAPRTAPPVREALARYVQSLARFGAHTDLVGARTPETLAEIALSDALVLARHPLLFSPPVWEIGAGGASLLVPMALALPTLTGTLVEPRQKRATFLRLAVGQCGLSSRLVIDQSRVEPETAPQGVAGAVCARAVLAPAAWVSLGDTIVRAGGIVVVLTSDDYVPADGRSPVATERYVLPFTHTPRVATLLPRGVRNGVG